MKIGIAGPVATENIARFLGGEIHSLPKGYSGAPFLGTLIGALIRRGHDVSVYTTSSDVPLRASEPVRVERKGFTIYYSPVRPHAIRFHGVLPGRILDGFALERHHLLRAIESDQPDVIHAHWAYEFALASMASGRPCVVTAHDSPLQVLRYMPNPYRFGRLLMAMRVLNRARFLTAVSPYLVDQIRKFAKVPIAVIPNPMPTAPRDSLRKDGPQECNAPVISMILNGWGRRKNPMMGLRAFNQLRAKMPSARLRLYGNDFGPGQLAERLARAKGLADGVDFVGNLPHLSLLAELSQSTLLMHPALEEACPLSLVEAMSVGVPVVAGSTSGGVPWVLDYGKCGMLTDVRSADLMCMALLQLLRDRDRYDALRDAAARRARIVFDADAVAEQYERQYVRAICGAA